MIRPLRALLVEDSVDDRDMLLIALEKQSFHVQWKQVQTAKGIEEALAAETYDIVLCDYNMPELDAPRALEVVRSIDPDLPFIIISGTLGEEVAVTAMKAGAHDFFAKGRLVRLGAAIERELHEARVRRERKRMQAEREELMRELQRALGARDEFMRIASHELRTPITVLSLQVDAMKRESERLGLRPDAMNPLRRLSRVDRQVERLTAIVERLLDATMLSSEPLRLVHSRVDLRELVLEVVDRSEDWIAAAGCTLKVAGLEEVVGEWDPVRLDTVITNLLGNALKFGAGKPVSLSLRKSGERALLGVADQGIGLGEREQQELFKKFSRVVPIDNYGGFGVGLWIVDQLVRAHGGSMRIDSQKGAGAVFTVDLPLKPADALAAGGASSGAVS